MGDQRIVGTAEDYMVCCPVFEKLLHTRLYLCINKVSTLVIFFNQAGEIYAALAVDTDSGIHGVNTFFVDSAVDGGDGCDESYRGKPQATNGVCSTFCDGDDRQTALGSKGICQCRRCVTGEGHALYALRFQKTKHITAELDEFLRTFVAVWAVCGVTVVNNVLVRQGLAQGKDYAESAHAGIHDTDGGVMLHHIISPMSVFE